MNITQLDAVERIEIFSHWSGFASPCTRAEKIVIARRDGRFVRERLPTHGHDEIAPAPVAELLAALARPIVAQLDPALFDIPASVITCHYASVWTDDGPSILVTITFTNGREIRIRSQVQQAYMLPFDVSDSATGEKYQTFDPRLSKAIAAVMPEGCLEKDRLDGHNGLLAHDLASAKPNGADVAHDEAVGAMDMDAEFEELHRILRNEESPAEKAEAHRAGKHSQRLLRRISLEDVRELLAAGADPRVADELGQTALMHASAPPLDREKFRLLVQAGADVQARRHDGCTGLHLDCAAGEARAVAEWLAAGADVHARGPGGATPLMLAANWRDVAVLLLRAGADVNAVDDHGHSALVYAIVKQSWVQGESELESMRMLIEAGADLNCVDVKGVTPLGHARHVLGQERLEVEVLSALHADAPSCEFRRQPLAMAESVLELIQSCSRRGQRGYFSTDASPVL